MRSILLSILSLFVFQTTCFSQTEYIEVNSSILKEKRQIKIQLPRNYDESEKEYPVIIVLDGDYLFEPFAGNTDYLSYWEIIPESIVVGINQAGYKEKDSKLGTEDEFPVNTGADFFEFIGYEVLRFIDDNYRTTLFTVIAGMDYMGNFSNYYLLKEKPLFSGYINLSPDVSSQLPDRLHIKLNSIDQKIWYYLGSAEHDIPNLKSGIKELDSQLSKIENPNVSYEHQVIEDADHYSFVADAIPKSLKSIFSSYSPISEHEYQNKFLSAESPANTLEDKYLTIQELYSINIPIRIVDFLKTEEAIEEKELWEDYKILSKLARKQSPGTVLYNYFQGRYFEKIGQPKRAIKEYQGAYGLEPAGYLDSDVLLGKADELKRTFGN